MTMSEALIRRYYAAFNSGDIEAMLACLAADVVHEVNQGGTRHGIEAFRAFLRHMARCYEEEVLDLVVMTAASGERAAAEFMVKGRYIATDEGLPEARGQTYELRAGTFLAIRDGLIGRVTTCYNLRDWIAQVRGGG